MAYLDGTGLGYLLGKIKAAFVSKTDAVAANAVDIDSTPTASSTNLVTSGGVYDEVHPATGSSQPAGGMLPNVLYKLGTLTGNVTIAFASPADNNIENEYKFTFDAGSTAPTVIWPNNITWAGNCIDSGTGLPVVSASKHYEISIEDSYGIAIEF